MKKEKAQWMLKITEYADKLLEGLETVNYIEKVVSQQRNWIGKSEGAIVNFKMQGCHDSINVFTTRPDTLFGSTYLVLAPEHPLIDKYKDKISNKDEVFNYINESVKKSDIDRTSTATEKNGVELKGLTAINPVNQKVLPIWISDYVLSHYGTGSIMAVPGHDDRDYAFAKKYSLDIISIIDGCDISEKAYTDKDSGILVNSDFLNGLNPRQAISRMTSWLEQNNVGKKAIYFKLRDWVFSRQRYWGEPIPVVNCNICGWVTIPESELPLQLPELDSFIPPKDGSSPLAKVSAWVNTHCSKCGKPAVRETDTMPQWAGSSWYYLRYIDPHNYKVLVDKEKEKILDACRLV